MYKSTVASAAIAAIASLSVWARADEPLVPGVTVRPQSSATGKPIDTETYRNQVVKAYAKAIQEKKYTLVLFSKSHHLNPFSQRMMQKLQSPQLAAFSDRVVMCLCDPELDSSSDGLHSALEVNAYPSLFVIKTHRAKIEVVAQIVGECDMPDLERTLKKALRTPVTDVGHYIDDALRP